MFWSDVDLELLSWQSEQFDVFYSTHESMQSAASTSCSAGTRQWDKCSSTIDWTGFVCIVKTQGCNLRILEAPAALTVQWAVCHAAALIGYLSA